MLRAGNVAIAVYDDIQRISFCFANGGQHHQSVFGEFAGQAVERRLIALARRTPGRPELDEYDFSLQGFVCELLAIESPGDKVRRLFVDIDGRELKSRQSGGKNGNHDLATREQLTFRFEEVVPFLPRYSERLGLSRSEESELLWVRDRIGLTFACRYSGPCTARQVRSRS